MLTSEQIRQARQMLGWSRADLARRTFLPLSVVEVVEEHGSTFMLLPGQMAAIVQAFEAAGVEFPSHGEPGVRLRKGGHHAGEGDR